MEQSSGKLAGLQLQRVTAGESREAQEAAVKEAGLGH